MVLCVPESGRSKRGLAAYHCAQPAALIVVICPHDLTLPSIDPDNCVVTRAATVNGEYPYPLAHLENGIVLKAVCGFRKVAMLMPLGLDTALPRRSPIHGFRDRGLCGVRTDPASVSCDRCWWLNSMRQMHVATL